MATSSSSTAPTGNDGDNGIRKRYQTAPPLSSRILYGVSVAALQNVVVGPSMVARNLYKRLRADETYPTEIKTYKQRPKLPVRIFFPKSYDRTAGAPRRPLPLLFSIHGGGFVVGSVSDNDVFNSRFSEVHSALVIALNYAKAPANPYPGPRLDLEALIAATFDDAELAPHIDLAKVAITGFSAGGSLTLSVSQMPAVREKVTAGIVPIYPVTDLSVTAQLKSETRRYKPQLPGMRGSKKDFLVAAAPVFDWAYVPVGQDVQDPLLSPFFATRDALPRRIWIVGCELDMLGHEAWRAACKYAGRAVPDFSQRIGQEEPVKGGKAGVLITEGDQRYAWEEKNRDGETKWMCVPDAVHGFDMADLMGADAETVQDGALKRDALIEMMGQWLFKTSE